jgi:hypothetical protein
LKDALKDVFESVGDHLPRVRAKRFGSLGGYVLHSKMGPCNDITELDKTGKKFGSQGRVTMII